MMCPDNSRPVPATRPRPVYSLGVCSKVRKVMVHHANNSVSAIPQGGTDQDVRHVGRDLACSRSLNSIVNLCHSAPLVASHVDQWPAILPLRMVPRLYSKIRGSPYVSDLSCRCCTGTLDRQASTCVGLVDPCSGVDRIGRRPGYHLKLEGTEAALFFHAEGNPETSTHQGSCKFGEVADRALATSPGGRDRGSPGVGVLAQNIRDNTHHERDARRK